MYKHFYPEKDLKAICNFPLGLAFEAYQQLMMDEELQIFTVNNFLKAMQMVEGIERLEDRQNIDKEFKKAKHRVMKKITDEKDGVCKKVL